MDAQARKAAVAAYKERPLVCGVYAVICNATGEAWVGANSNVDTYRNGLWFSLRMGSARAPTLQAAWSAHGEDAFRYEVLDLLPPDHSALLRQDELKRRAALWCARLQARSV